MANRWFYAAKHLEILERGARAVDCCRQYGVQISRGRGGFLALDFAIDYRSQLPKDRRALATVIDAHGSALGRYNRKQEAAVLRAFYERLHASGVYQRGVWLLMKMG